MNRLNCMTRRLCRVCGGDKRRKSSEVSSSQSSQDGATPLHASTASTRFFDPDRGVRILCYDTTRSPRLWLHLFMCFIVCSMAWFFLIFWSRSVLLSDKIILRDNCTACARIWHDAGFISKCPNHERGEACPCTERTPCIATIAQNRFYNIDVSYYGIWVFKDNDPLFDKLRWRKAGWRWCKQYDPDCRECQIQEKSKEFYRWKSNDDIPFFTPYKLLTLALWSVSAGIIFVTLVGYKYMRQTLQGNTRRCLNRLSVICGVAGAIFLCLMPLSPMNRVMVLENDWVGAFHMHFAMLAFMFLGIAEMFMISATWGVVQKRVSLFWCFTLVWVGTSSSLWMAWLGSVHEWLAVAAIFSFYIPQCFTGFLNWRDWGRNHKKRNSSLIRFSNVSELEE